MYTEYLVCEKLLLLLTVFYAYSSIPPKIRIYILPTT